MSHLERKLVLSGGIASPPFMQELFELAGTNTPQMVFDGSPCVLQDSLDKKRKTWNTAAAQFGIPQPLWLQDYVDEPLSRGRVNALLDRADALYVTGGASRNAMARWNESGVTQDMFDRVDAGDIVASGGSAGAMVWFNKGLSDSEYYDVPDGEHWDYKPVQESALFDTWVMAHYTDKDNLGRDKQAQFTEFLKQYAGEWNYALGIDTCAALVCIGGIAQVRDITPLSRRGEGFGASIYLYLNGLETPRKLDDGDVIPLANL